MGQGWLRHCREESGLNGWGTSEPWWGFAQERDVISGCVWRVQGAEVGWSLEEGRVRHETQDLGYV